MAFRRKRIEMKEAVRAMKANAVTKEDKEAVKECKAMMKAELKDTFKAFKKEKKYGKHEKNPDRLKSKHVADVTIPDNSLLPPDTHVTKTWRLRNNGAIAWPAGCELLFISRLGDNINGPEKVALTEPVLPDQEVDVSVSFITPAESGRYVGYYRLASPEGDKFGQRVWVSFLIPSPSAPTDAKPQ